MAWLGGVEELVGKGERDGIEGTVGGVEPVAGGLAQGFALGFGIPGGVGDAVEGEPLLGVGGVWNAEALPHAGGGGVDVLHKGADAEGFGERGKEGGVTGGFALGGELVEALAACHGEVVGEEGFQVWGMKRKRDVM